MERKTSGLHRYRNILILTNLILLPTIAEAFFIKKIFGGEEETTTTPAPIIIKYGGDPGEYPYPPIDKNIIQLADSYPSLTTALPSLYSIPSILVFLLGKLFKGWLSLFPQISYEGNDPGVEYYNYPPPPSFSGYHNHGPPRISYTPPPPPRSNYPSGGPSPPWSSQPYEESGNNYEWQDYPPTAESQSPEQRRDANEWQKRFSAEENTRVTDTNSYAPRPYPPVPPSTTPPAKVNDDSNWLESFAQNANYIKSHKTPYETFALSSRSPGSKPGT